MEKDLWHPRSQMVIGWTPKAGCTVVQKMFFDHCGLLEEAQRFDPWIHNYRMRFLKPCPPSERKKLVCFKVVRNPYSRAVSGYLQICFKAFPDHSFSSFEHFLDVLSTGHNKHRDAHYAPQYRTGESYDEILRLEEMDTTIPFLNEKYGWNLRWGFTSDHHVQKQKNLETGYLGNHDFSQSRVPIASYKMFYNAENKRRVEFIYREDFVHYGYTYHDFLNDAS